MAGNLWGADVAELRTLAQQFGKTADLLLQQSTQLTSHINSTTSWKGQDAVAFRSEWNGSHRAMLQQAAFALKQESKKLLENANQQEEASDGEPGSGGGHIPAGSGSGSTENPWGPDWLAKGSPFRDGWAIRSQFKNALDLPKNVFGLAAMASKGLDEFTDATRWAKLPANSVTYNLLDSGTDLLGLKNLQKYVPALNQFGGVFKESTWLFKGHGPVLESLGKGGLGRGLGWAGVGLNAFDAAGYIAAGKTEDAVWSGAKAALGVACFLPPPAGTICTVVSAGIAVYEIPAVKEFVNDAAGNVVDTVASAVKDPGKFVEDTGENLADLGRGAASFLGFG
ncbi:uncharacterized protein YukE [Arthrobacter sp. SLBN-100]|uniref:WXG100 family type VII secretion target n=1 Tax=Arthrobacter sp. SLBN-100 TaxID=2768450 RepID=UPI00114EE163|nr:WXG100 family type VII secretion target [Arthrobacter sp. SLBN-100]TQJ67505.1 uncharacterized protein YukE [Arthrobacter sp. SLBN-100]